MSMNGFDVHFCQISCLLCSMKNACLLSIFLICSFSSCQNNAPDESLLRKFEDYQKALREESGEEWNLTADTIRIWFDDKSGDPLLRVRGSESRGPWSAWDEEMHAATWPDSIWVETREHAVKGYFFENNDFYELIGKAPTRTLRTYWFNENDRIDEILIYWIPEENTTSTEHLQPIVEWAMVCDSSEIRAIYPDGQIVPSRENAIRWKKLLRRYRARQD
jgi:hypothetical protein